MPNFLYRLVFLQVKRRMRVIRRCGMYTGNYGTDLRKGPRIIFWVVIICMVGVGLIATAGALSYRPPFLINDRVHVIDYKQPVPANDISTNGSSFQHDSRNGAEIPGERNARNKTDFRIKIKLPRKRQTHVAFLKVHKAGSSTMRNIFFRFGLRHKLNILLPKSGNYLFNTTTPKVHLKRGEHFDIFACHTVYNKTWFDSLLPADSVRIGIVREPISRMISSAYYYRDVWREGYLRKIPRENFIHNLVSNPEQYETSFFSRTKNSMGKDFGFKSNIKQDDKSKIRKFLDELNSEFLLVLVMERFDESLVLMKRVLNWSFVDIIYLKSNSHKHNPVVLNDTEKEMFRKTSFLDFEIYEYFSNIFQTKLKEAGNFFEDEVSYFKTIIGHVSEFCSKSNKPRDDILVIQSSNWDGEFQVTATDCEWMQTEAIPFIDKLRNDKLYAHWDVTNKVKSERTGQ